MKPLADQLVSYANYHRDRRNIATHLVGIPMIVFAVVILLSRPHAIFFDTLPLTPAFLAALLVSLYYLKLDLAFGLLMSVVFAALLNLAFPIAASSTAVWLGWGLGLFIVGWIFQAVGHVWEGRKPAFFDDIRGLIIGPLFVAAEVVFKLGMRKNLALEIEQRAGKTRTKAAASTRQ